MTCWKRSSQTDTTNVLCIMLYKAAKHQRSHLMSRMAHDLFWLIQNLSCKGACHSKVCNDDAVLGVFAPSLKELPVLHHAGIPSDEACATSQSKPIRLRHCIVQANDRCVTIIPTAAHTIESERLGRVEQTRLYGRTLCKHWALKPLHKFELSTSCGLSTSCCVQKLATAQHKRTTTAILGMTERLKTCRRLCAQ